MCSIDPDNLLVPHKRLMTATEHFQTCTLKCNKCKEGTPCVLLRDKDAYCKSCFLNAAFHKFKVLLGKTKLVRPNDRVLVLYRIGHASTAMLHLLRAGLDMKSSKKIMYQPIILFVDGNDDILALSKKQDILNAIRNQANDFKFKLYYVSFAEYLNQKNISSIIRDATTCEDMEENNLIDFKTKKISETWKSDIKQMKMRELLVDVAKNLSCRFVFTPEISSDIASNLLANISLGRGTDVSIDTGFCDNRDEDVKILRPLRLFDMKELVYYNIFNKVEPIAFVGPKENPYLSVQSLMKKFVNDLQVNYPATVTTVVKTGDKLCLDRDATRKKCEMCKGSLIYNDDQLSSAESTKFSHFVSTHQPNCSSQDSYDEIIQLFTRPSTLENKYCFACSKIANYIL